MLWNSCNDTLTVLVYVNWRTLWSKCNSDTNAIVISYGSPLLPYKCIIDVSPHKSTKETNYWRMYITVLLQAEIPMIITFKHYDILRDVVRKYSADNNNEKNQIIAL